VQMGFAGLLTLLFVALKLTGFIAWSWWWVLSPVWIVVLLSIVFGVVGAIVIRALAVARTTRRRY